ncbi:MAG: DUF2065 domain-containing protein [Dongiaceae bacterium]
MPGGVADLITALGLVLVIEGVLLALFPDRLRRMIAAMLAQPAQAVRIAGLACAVVGVGIVWLIRG